MPLRLSTYAVQIAELDALGCEVEHNFLNDKIKSVTAYFGLLSAVADLKPLAEPSLVDSAPLEAFDNAVSSHALCFVSTHHSPRPGGGNTCALPPLSAPPAFFAASPLSPHSAAEPRRAERP